MARSYKGGRCASISRKSVNAVVAVVAVVGVAVVAAAAAVATTAAEVDAVADISPDYHPVATAVGEAWATEIVRSMRQDEREIAGAWPGTLGEARMRIRVAVRTRLTPQLLEELARVAYVAARRGWQEISVQDPEA
jgi:hypothetical protein